MNNSETQFTEIEKLSTGKLHKRVTKSETVSQHKENLTILCLNIRLLGIHVDELRIC